MAFATSSQQLYIKVNNGWKEVMVRHVSLSPLPNPLVSAGSIPPDRGAPPFPGKSPFPLFTAVN